MLSIGTIILTLLILFIYKKSENYNVFIENIISITLIIEVLVIRGYFFKKGNFLIDYTLTMHLFSLIVIGSYVYINMAKISTRLKSYVIVMLGMQLLCLIINYINPPIEYIIDSWDNFFINESDKQRLFNISTYTLELLFISLPSLLSVCMLKMYSNTKHLNIRNVLRKTNRVLDFYLLVLLIQAITVVIFNNNFIDGVFELLCGPGTEQTTEIRQRFHDMNNIHGIGGESSFLAYSMYLSCLLFYFEYKFDLKLKKLKIRIALSVLYMFLSGAFSMLLFLMLLSIYFCKQYLSKKQIYYIIVPLILVILFAISMLGDWLEGEYFYYRLMLVIEAFGRIGDMNVYGIEDSSLVRFTSIFVLMKKVIEFNPLLGLGMGVQGAHNGLVMLFADMGVLGGYVWYRFISDGIKRAKMDFFILIIVQNIFFGFKFYVYFSTVLIYLLLDEVYKANGKENI